MIPSENLVEGESEEVLTDMVDIRRPLRSCHLTEVLFLCILLVVLKKSWCVILNYGEVRYVEEFNEGGNIVYDEVMCQDRCPYGMGLPFWSTLKRTKMGHPKIFYSLKVVVSNKK